MRYKLFILLLSLSVLSLSCDSNLYFFADEKATVKDSNASIDIAYIQDNCGYVKSQYELMLARGENLTETDRYKYASSIFACSGYSVTRNLALILGTGDNTSLDPYDMIFSLMGVDFITKPKISELSRQYNIAIDQCVYARTDNFKLLCGFISSADNIISITDVLLVALNVPTINPSQKEVETMLKGKNVTVGTLANLIDGLSANDPRYLPNLTKNYFAVSEAIDVLERATPGISFAKSLSELNLDLLDEATQRVTVQYLALKIYSFFKLDATP